MKITIEPMFGGFIGAWEWLFVMMALIGTVVIAVVAVIVAIVIFTRRQSNTKKKQSQPAAASSSPPVAPATEITPHKCPQCGTPLPAGALAGLCPICLLKAGAAADTITDAKQPGFNPPSVAELAPLFPQLEILELIGKGGMGAVYKARQKQLDRIVALKILPPGIGADPAFAERFAREAKALAKLNHPGIVTLYEFGETSGQFYFLMEFVDGVNLRQLLHAGRVSPREALAIVPQICDALQFAHDQGIVHRDIKPENILLDRRGRVKVADFGLAKIVGNEGRAELPLGPDARQRVPTDSLTDAGKVMGTPQYMSPEQIQAPGEVDHRADIYALGVVFYQMLTGELPAENIEPPSSKVQIDVRLDEVVLRALEKRPELRYQQVSQVKTCVETIVNSGGAGVPPADSGSSRRLPRQSESAAGEEAQTEKSEIGNRKSEIAPRFSRTAIVGACWLAFVPLHFLISLLIPSHNWFFEIIAFVQALLFWTAPVGMTILGWIGVSQIRGSAGKLRGLGLAVFDGLFFPLLAMDAAIVGALFLGFRLLDATFHQFSTPVGLPILLLAPIVLGILGVLFFVDFLIIRAVWRAVNKGGAGVPPAGSSQTEGVKPQPETSPKRSQQSSGSSWFWLVAVIALHGVMVLGVAIFLVTFVAHFIAVFSGLHGRLPEATQLMFSFSDFVRHGGYLLIPVVLVLDVVICWLLRKFAGITIFIAWAVAVMLALVLVVASSMFMISFTVSNLGDYVSDGAGTTSAPISVQAASNTTFGPVMELVVTNNTAINVGSGQIKALPGTWTNQKSSNEKDIAVCTWLEQANTDFAFLGGDGIYGMTRDMTTLKRGEWDSYSAANFAGSLHDLGRNVASKFGKAEPLNDETNYTYAFKTGAGQFGLLQITGYTDNPRGVKIRYKLVQRAATPVSLIGESSLPRGVAVATKAVTDFGGGVVRDAAGRVVKVHLIYSRHDANDNPYGDSLNTNTTDAICEWLPVFQDAQQLMLYRGQATDRAMQYIAQMTNLSVLGISYADALTDSGFRSLKSLVNLREVYLPECRRLNDEALAVFKYFPKLEKLDLTGTAISDAGLDQLSKLPQLKKLSVGDTLVTRRGVERLRQARNDLELNSDFPPLSDNPTNFARTETIVIAVDGALTLSGEACPVEQLTERLKQLAARQPVSVEIRADARVAMKWVTTVTKSCEDAGLRYKLVQAAGTPPNPAATATPPAPMTALDALKVARPVADEFAALSAALDRGDLPLAQSLATSLVADVESYNHSVQGTAYEYPQSVRDALALCLDALKARDLPLARSRLAAIYALLNSSARPSAAQNPSSRPAVSPSTDLKSRLEAAGSITSFTEQDKALAAIVRDAAKAGEAALAKQALAKMTSFTAQDQAALEAARELVKAGRRTDAIDIARSMTSFTLRDAALKELAQ